MYLDPPYVDVTQSGKMYKFGMDDAQQIEMLEAIQNHAAAILLSGYENELYENYLTGWKKETIHTRAAQVKENDADRTRTEVLWINPVAAKQSKQLTLFD